jgi:RND superfamily putative drug exporter
MRFSYLYSIKRDTAGVAARRKTRALRQVASRHRQKKAVMGPDHDKRGDGKLDAICRTVVRRRWWALAAWLVIVVVSASAASGLPDLFKSQAGVPGTDAQRTEDLLQRQFGQKSLGAFTLVARDRGRPADALIAGARAAARRAAARLPTGKVASVRPVSEHVVAADIVSRLDPLEADDHTAALRRAAGTVPGAETWLTGGPAIQSDMEPVFADDLKVGELYIAVPIALAVLIFVFGTAAFLIPMLFALAAIPTTLGAVWIFAHFMDMEQTVQNLVTLIGLGIAIDYSLLIVYRYREELRHTRDREAAMVRTMQTAGHAVVFSGTAVAIGLALLILMPVPGLRGYGVAGLLIPLVSIACALTLLPAILFIGEARLDRIRLIPRRILQSREAATEHNLWSRLAARIMRRPVPFMATSLTLLLLAAAPVLAIELGPGTQEKLPSSISSVQGLRVLQAAVGDGALSPAEIVIDTGRPKGFDAPESQAAAGALFEALGNDREIIDISDFGQGPQYLDGDRRYVHLQATGSHDAGRPESETFIRRVRNELVPRADFPAGTKVYVGGSAAFGVDFLDKTYSAFPLLVGAVLLLTYVLLLRAFRSVLLPLKAIVLNMLSIAAAYGLLVAAFKWGWGNPLGLIEYEQITGWIPVFLFAMLFGLSMDYEVFLVSRMREEWDATHDNARAVTTGLAKTGRLVTAAGIVMFAAFMGFVAGSLVDLQQFGFGLAIAILIDVTIVRALVLPSAMRLLGRWNWWLPDWMARLLRVAPSPLERPSSVAAAVTPPRTWRPAAIARQHRAARPPVGTHHTDREDRS